MCTYLKMVPEGTNLLTLHADKGLISPEGYQALLRTSVIGYCIGLAVLNTCKDNTPNSAYVLYNGYEVLPVIDESDTVVAMAIDACAPKWEAEFFKEYYLHSTREAITELVKDYGVDAWVEFIDVDFRAVIYAQNDEHLGDISYFEVDQY